MGVCAFVATRRLLFPPCAFHTLCLHAYMCNSQSVPVTCHHLKHQRRIACRFAPTQHPDPSLINGKLLPSSLPSSHSPSAECLSRFQGGWLISDYISGPVPDVPDVCTLLHVCIFTGANKGMGIFEWCRICHKMKGICEKTKNKTLFRYYTWATWIRGYSLGSMLTLQVYIYIYIYVKKLTWRKNRH